MSSNNKRKLTSKEAEILAKQRRVAVKLTTAATASSSSNSSTKPTKPPPPPRVPSSKQAALVQTKNQREQVKKLLKRPSSTKPSIARPSAAALAAAAAAAKQKRPTLKAKSAESALQAARQRVGGSGSAAAAAKPARKPAPPSGDSPHIKRKTSMFASLISASVSTSVSAPPMEAGSYGQVDPEDFWKNLRDWDFVSQYARSQESYKQKKDREKDNVLFQKKPLPDRFINHRHYIASWAPLCLAEARAQLISENSTSKNKFVPVTVETNKKNLGSALDCIIIIVQAKHRSSRDEHKFHPNDACLLVPERHAAAVQKVFNKNNGNSSNGPSNEDVSWRNYALLGHTEYMRRSLDGLQLKVSKKWWAKVSDGKEDWSLLKVGCNITALREFTALCRMDSLPMKKYLLGQDLADGGAVAAAAKAKKKEGTKTKEELLKSMGGVTKLGKGFTKYAHKKFNASQLQAISSSASGYGDGGFTLIKGPPGTGKTTTLVAILNSLHIRQFNKYYEDLKRIAGTVSGNRKAAIGNAVRAKPRLLVCAPSNAAVDNVILKIMEDGFIDGSGKRYNPSIIRVGVGKSITVKDVALENQVDAILSEHMDLSKLESSIAGYKMELQRIQSDISKIRARLGALIKASPWPLSKDWEIRIDEGTFEHTGRVYFVNHIEKKTSYECPPPPEPDETQYEATAMPEYRSYMARVVKLYESYNSITTKLERCTITQQGLNGGNSIQVRQQLETHILDTVHIVMTTLGTSGNRVLEAAHKFEVVVVDEAAQSVEPSILSALQLGSKHAILVGDPQQLPATIFNVSGRNTKYDRSLFQRLEEAGHEVFMLNTQYRMHPKISHFPREIFYGGDLKDGPNVQKPDYGDPLKRKILKAVPSFQPFTVLDLESREERGGSSYANSAEANLAVHLFCQLRDLTNGLSTATRIAVITPYSQQAALLRRTFQGVLGPHYTNFIEINTVDAFQGREANIVIFSCVRAAGSHGIGFLSDVRRMNVALTRAKHFLLVIARCKSITVNPYWRDLVDHARENNAVVEVPMTYGRDKPSFPELHNLKVPGTSTASSLAMKPNDPRNPNKGDPRLTMRPKPPPQALAPSDPRAKSEPPIGDPRASKPPPPPPRSADPRKALDPRGKPSGDTFAAKDPRKKTPPNDPRKARGYNVG